MAQFYDVVIVGGGPAGLHAAAQCAQEIGEKNAAAHVLIIERASRLGGILNQCIHTGFGLMNYNEELSGPEYAHRAEAEMRQYLGECVDVKTNTMVVELKSLDKRAQNHGHDARGLARAELICMSEESGIETIQARSVILAMGCRERPRGNLAIPGTRPQGVYTAGLAQHLVNIEGVMPGHNVVILGSGDIGLIMARRMTLEGAKVQCVLEIMPQSAGLKRNIVQCLDDFGIPLLLNHTIVSINGYPRVESVNYAEVDETLTPIEGTEKTIACDCVLLSVGLIPETELALQAELELNPNTRGPKVNEQYETSKPGIFACGNVLHVHDLVDFVAQEAKSCAHCALISALDTHDTPDDEIPVVAGDGVNQLVPQVLSSKHVQDDVVLRMRPKRTFEHVRLCVYADDKLVFKKPYDIVVPQEMLQITLKQEKLGVLEGARELRVVMEAMHRG